MVLNNYHSWYLHGKSKQGSLLQRTKYFFVSVRTGLGNEPPSFVVEEWPLWPEGARLTVSALHAELFPGRMQRHSPVQYYVAARVCACMWEAGLGQSFGARSVDRRRRCYSIPITTQAKTRSCREIRAFDWIKPRKAVLDGPSSRRMSAARGRASVFLRRGPVSERWTKTTECRATELWTPWRWRARCVASGTTTNVTLISVQSQNGLVFVLGADLTVFSGVKTHSHLNLPNLEVQSTVAFSPEDRWPLISCCQVFIILYK